MISGFLSQTSVNSESEIGLLRVTIFTQISYLRHYIRQVQGQLQIYHKGIERRLIF